MKKLILITVFLAVSAFTFSQSRLVINDNGYLVITNSAYLVIDNAATNAITTAGTGGNIVSEAELNRVKWNIATATGTYTVPFTTGAGVKIPLSASIGTAGTGAGNITFSTYNGPWDNDTYRPSDVTHMFDYATGTVNNSDKVIDRFWIMDPIGYTAKPALSSILFTYSNAEWSAIGNSIVEGNLAAQRFNSSTLQWGDMLPIGTANTVAKTVTTPAVTSANFFRSWTLVDNSSPLPIKLLSFTANCREGKAVIQWSTASEINNDYFTIEKTKDGITFATVATIKGAGNSNSVLNYSFTVENPEQGIYYRLSQTDFDGTTEIFDLISFECGAAISLDIVSVYNAQGSITGTFNIPVAGKYTLTIMDVRGRLIYKDDYKLFEGSNQVPLNIMMPATGIYLIRLNNDSEQVAKRFFIQ